MSADRSIGRRATALLAGVVLLAGACTTQPGQDRSGPKPDSAKSEPTPSPRNQAKTKLTAALDYLSDAPVLHYDGELTIGGQAVSADLRVSRHGVALGSLRDVPGLGATSDPTGRLRLLTVGDKTFVKTGKTFWKSLAGAGENQRRKASYLAKRWVAIDPAPLGDPATRLRPSEVAAELSNTVETNGISKPQPTLVDDTNVTKISSAGSTFYITDTQPYRIVRMIPAPGLLTPSSSAPIRPSSTTGSSSTTGTDLTIQPASTQSTDTPADEPTDEPTEEPDSGIDIGDLDTDAIDDFYNTVRDQAKKLDDSVDSRVQFNANATPAFTCNSLTFSCFANIHLTNTVQGGPDVIETTGTVRADLHGTITVAGIGIRQCRDSTTMRPNSTGSVRCHAAFPKPPPSRYPRTYPVTGQWFVIARADLEITRIIRDLEQDRNRDLDDSTCRTYNSFAGDTRILMAGGSTRPVSQIRIGDRVLATNPETGEHGARNVTAVWIHRDELVDLELKHANGQAVTVTTTEDHPFWNSTDQAWQRADSLDSGETLYTTGKRGITTKGVAWTTQHAGSAYNLTVADLQTYYVLAGKTPVLVHNSDRCPTDVALGIRNNGLREFADRNRYTHYLDSDIWEAEVRAAAHNPNVRLHILLDGFRGTGPSEQFANAYRNGSGKNWYATEREMYHVGKAVRVGDRSWDSIVFYRGGVEVKVPMPDFLSGR